MRQWVFKKIKEEALEMRERFPDLSNFEFLASMSDILGLTFYEDNLYGLIALTYYNHGDTPQAERYALFIAGE